MAMGNVESRPAFYLLARFHDRRRLSLQGVPAHSKNVGKLQRMTMRCSRNNNALFQKQQCVVPETTIRCSRNNAARDELGGIARWRKPAGIIVKELSMRHRILAMAAI